MVKYISAWVDYMISRKLYSDSYFTATFFQLRFYAKAETEIEWAIYKMIPTNDRRLFFHFHTHIETIIFAKSKLRLYFIIEN